jgi:hypothetical protein
MPGVLKKPDLVDQIRLSAPCGVLSPHILSLPAAGAA